ncbi:PREDICTED: uncharacterized protein LOC104115794 [Olea europaea subsp. europaea]|uniref:PREDICTED: uncharacterized protein LOC104115794 n=1 Tax=Olea europaea subsp. europaea TaxID=158383 RepID=A0A8S0SYC0_OLEEU|nr:PREDICTED: uncharacterized protein LOC104115794 [Olea europaea subsp. europaea]
MLLTLNSVIAGIHRHFVLYGLTEYMSRRLSCPFISILHFNRSFTADDVLKLLDRFYNLEMVKPDEEDEEILNKEEDFRLPESYFPEE